MFRDLSIRCRGLASYSIFSQQRFISTRPQTIYALSSSPGKAGVAVVRISGKSAKEVTISKQNQPRVTLLSLIGYYENDIISKH